MSTADTEDDLAVDVTITDGGQMQPPEQEDPDSVDITRSTAEEEQESEEAEEEEESEEAEQQEGEEQEESEGEEQEAEEEEAEEQKEESEEESGETTILDLTIDGLYLDLLGLEVDLDEVHLDIIAREGEGKLLGNLLSAVGGLLDSPDLLGGLDGLGDLIPSVHPIQRAKDLASAMTDRLRGMGDKIVDRLMSAIPFEQLLSRFFEALVDHLVPIETESEEEEAQAA